MFTLRRCSRVPGNEGAVVWTKEPSTNGNTSHKDGATEVAGANESGLADTRAGPTRIDRNTDSLIVERRLATNPADQIDERKMNARAMEVLKRVQDKLLGTDDSPEALQMTGLPVGAVVLGFHVGRRGGEGEHDGDEEEWGGDGHGLAANETAHCGRNDGLHISRERRASLSTLKGKNGDLDMSAQVDRLINEAQDHTNLCQLYWGWNPMW